MEIRKAAAEDFETAFQFICALWDYNTYDKAEIEKVYRRVLADEYSFIYFLIDQGEYKGFCHGCFFDTFWMSGATCYLASLFTTEKERNKGYGTALINFVRELAAEKGCRAIALDSGISRISAHKFYENCGFVKSCYGFDMELSHPKAK